MLFSELINVLKLKQLVLDANLHEDFRISDIKQIKRLSEATEDDTLYYFAKNADLEKILSSAEEKTQLQNAILPIDAVKMASEIALNYMLTDDKHLSTLVDEVKSLLKKKQNSNIFPYYPLSNTIVSMRDLADVFKEIQQRSGCALLAIDLNGKIIAASQKLDSFDETWREALSTHVLPAKSLTNVRNAFDKHFLEYATELIPAKKITTASKLFIAAIGPEKAPVGYILVNCDNDGDEAKVEYYVPMLSHMCANVVKKVDLSQDLDPYLYRSLLADLMRQDILLDAKKHIASSGLTFPNCMAVLLLQPDPLLGKRYLAKDLPALVAEVLHNVPYVVQGDLVTYLVHLEDNAHFPKDVDAKLRELIVKHKLKCGMSNAFFNPEAFAKYYDQANKAMLFSKQLHNDRVINCYEDFCTYDMVFQLPKDLELSYFLHTALVILKNADRKNDSDLYKSLKVFTENGFNISKTSKALYIHRNTFSYRKQQIEDLCGIDFDEPELNYKLKTAFILDEIINGRKESVSLTAQAMS